MASHHHRYRFSASTGNQVTFRCSCGKSKSRKMTPQERKVLRAQWKECGLIHRVWFSFVRRFMDPKQETFRYRGYDLSVRVERWAKKYPGDVRIITCDDSVHSTSSLVFIEHRTETSYMGTTVVFIPQCSGGPPAEFFLYPMNVRNLMATLKDIQKQARPIKRIEQAAEAKLGHWKF